MRAEGQNSLPTVVCMGSLNMDMCVEVAEAPLAGETVLAQTLRYSPGGKGANQAVACARQGAHVRMVGSVGPDAHGAVLIESLQADGIDTLAVDTNPVQPTGIAMVLVESTGQNRIVVAGGANQAFQWDAVTLAPVLKDAFALVLQLESPVSEVVKAAQSARTSGCRVVLNPSPVPDAIPGALWPLVDLLVLNETEALALCGLDVSASRDNALQAVRHFQQWGIARIVLTLGSSGAISADGEMLIYHPAARVDVVDTTAAGDTFLGALVAAWAADLPFEQCVHRGMAAASLCVQIAGAQTSIPTRAQTEANVSVPDWQKI